jgi:Ca2+-transporting ATPase
MIEMFNALNALSDEGSLLSVGLFANPLLIIAIMGSVILHCVILYIPFFARIFGTSPLTANDWKLVMVFSLPVILLDELLKVIARYRT